MSINFSFDFFFLSPSLSFNTAEAGITIHNFLTIHFSYLDRRDYAISVVSASTTDTNKKSIGEGETKFREIITKTEQSVKINAISYSSVNFSGVYIKIARHGRRRRRRRSSTARPAPNQRRG